MMTKLRFTKFVGDNLYSNSTTGVKWLNMAIEGECGIGEGLALSPWCHNNLKISYRILLCKCVALTSACQLHRPMSKWAGLLLSLVVICSVVVKVVHYNFQYQSCFWNERGLPERHVCILELLMAQIATACPQCRASSCASSKGHCSLLLCRAR